MKVKILHDFRDRTADLKLRKVGETLDVDEARATKLESLNLAERIQETTEKEPKQTAK